MSSSYPTASPAPLSRLIVAVRVAIAVAAVLIPVLILMFLGVIAIMASVASGSADRRHHG